MHRERRRSFTKAEYDVDMTDELTVAHFKIYCLAWYERGKMEKPFEEWRQAVRFKLWCRMVSIGGLYQKEGAERYNCNI